MYVVVGLPPGVSYGLCAALAIALPSSDQPPTFLGELCSDLHPHRLGLLFSQHKPFCVHFCSM